MKRNEAVYREILHKAIEGKNARMTQSELSKKLGISLSIVNAAVKRLDVLGAVKIHQRNFAVIDIMKIMYLWASFRNLEKDVVFKARLEKPVRDIEREMPDVMFTAFTAYKLMFNDVPADYSEVYVYADEEELEEIRRRVKHKESRGKTVYKPNLIVLKKDQLLALYKNIPIGQMFVDLWNIREWYAADFARQLEMRIARREQ